MRIAWLGPPPSDDPGVPTVATLLIEGLVHAGIEVDVYAATGQTQVSQRLRRHARVVLYTAAQGGRWDRWYSRGDVVQHHLTDELRERHREVGYDLAGR